MDSDDMKPFDPSEVDETLTRVVAHGGKTHLLFPYVHATGSIPEYKSIGIAIAGAAATVQDFHQLAVLIRKAGGNARWRIVFNTPWLIGLADEGEAPRVRRE